MNNGNYIRKRKVFQQLKIHLKHLINLIINEKKNDNYIKYIIFKSLAIFDISKRQIYPLDTYRNLRLLAEGEYPEGGYYILKEYQF